MSKSREELLDLIEYYQNLLDIEGYSWLNYSMWSEYLDELIKLEGLRWALDQ